VEDKLIKTLHSKKKRLEDVRNNSTLHLFRPKISPLSKTLLKKVIIKNDVNHSNQKDPLKLARELINPRYRDKLETKIKRFGLDEDSDSYELSDLEVTKLSQES
jgi:predicted glycosyltransferase